MPMSSIPVESRSMARELARNIRDAESATMRDYWRAQADGFFLGLTTVLPSEAVGLLVMEHDDELAGGEVEDE